MNSFIHKAVSILAVGAAVVVGLVQPAGADMRNHADAGISCSPVVRVVHAGDQYDVTCNVTNSGPDVSEGTFVVAGPAGDSRIEWVYSDDMSCTDIERTMATCQSYDDMVSGEHYTITYRVSVPTDARTGESSGIVATVANMNEDRNPANNVGAALGIVVF